jgi:hypothetical protein
MLKKAVRHAQILSVGQMRAECESFDITADYCHCEQTVLVSLVYRIYIPCSRKFSIGVSLSTCSDEIRLPICESRESLDLRTRIRAEKTVLMNLAIPGS